MHSELSVPINCIFSRLGKTCYNTNGIQFLDLALLKYLSHQLSIQQFSRQGKMISKIIFNYIVPWILSWKNSFLCNDLDQITNHQSRNTTRISSSKMSRVGEGVENNTVLPPACIDKKCRSPVYSFTVGVDAPLHFSEVKGP